MFWPQGTEKGHGRFPNVRRMIPLGGTGSPDTVAGCPSTARARAKLPVDSGQLETAGRLGSLLELWFCRCFRQRRTQRCVI